jgi:hypothetical protein
MERKAEEQPADVSHHTGLNLLLMTRRVLDASGPQSRVAGLCFERKIVFWLSLKILAAKS